MQCSGESRPNKVGIKGENGPVGKKYEEPGSTIGRKESRNKQPHKEVDGKNPAIENVEQLEVQSVWKPLQA